MDKDGLKKIPALAPPRTVDASEREGRPVQWGEQVRVAMEARRMGSQLRRGKIKSFRPVVGRI